MSTLGRVPAQDAREILEVQVRDAHGRCAAAGTTALEHACEAGACLTAIIRQYARRAYGGKTALYERTCGSARTGRIYVFLDRYRDLISATGRASADFQDHSIASALARIRELRGTKKTAPQCTQAPLVSKNLATFPDAELVTEINRRGGAGWLLGSSDLREQLEARLAGQSRARKRRPFKPAITASTAHTAAPVCAPTPTRGYEPDPGPADPRVIEDAANVTRERWDRIRGRRIHPTLN
jgi:hypothetical protein